MKTRGIKALLSVLLENMDYYDKTFLGFANSCCKLGFITAREYFLLQNFIVAKYKGAPVKSTGMVINHDNPFLVRKFLTDQINLL